LFLKLTDRFYRSDRVHLDLNDLTTNGLGYSATVPLKARKQKLLRCLDTLLVHGIISLGKGHRSSHDLILKREKGRYLAILFRGPYFDRTNVDTRSKKNPADDPLYGPMQALGIDEPMIAKLLAKSSRPVLDRWLRITEAAVNEKPAGFPGFKVSPAAFFVDGVLNERMPPDWMYQLEKLARRKQFEAEAAKMKAVEQLLTAEYEKQRREAVQSFLRTESGKKLYDGAYRAAMALWQAKGEPQPLAHRLAVEDAIAWTERCDEFSFPELAVWALARQNHDN
jgi:hypothetical protein